MQCNEIQRLGDGLKVLWSVLNKKSIDQNRPWMWTLGLFIINWNLLSTSVYHCALFVKRAFVFSLAMSTSLEINFTHCLLTNYSLSNQSQRIYDEFNANTYLYFPIKYSLRLYNNVRFGIGFEINIGFKKRINNSWYNGHFCGYQTVSCVTRSYKFLFIYLYNRCPFLVIWIEWMKRLWGL